MCWLWWGRVGHLTSGQARGVRRSEHVVAAGVHQRGLLLRIAAPQEENQAAAVRAQRADRRVSDQLPPGASTCLGGQDEVG